ncbi:MAG: Nuclease SbcCD subunit C [Chloroflexi bacterium ADurb.Bin325]|nr:MAG: Nuclease SbcCD subunit C [Chloroflexi bacterium ADurb.Bin325]
MIPHKLKLHNFMCYREEQSLDFSGIHLACLTGDNGHGKSALLDAMTWALWGRARARRDDELIALGESEMWVDLEFGLGPQRYRVWRQRSTKGRGRTDLHLYVWNAGREEWQLLDEGNVNERQAQIIRTLRMEYDTFVNSAFLLQGRADSFTVKTASERKQILADILGLSRYDLYEERAKEEVRLHKERAIHVQGEIGGIDHALARRGEYEAGLADARQAVSRAVDTLRAAEAQQTALRLQVQGLRGQAQQLADLRNRLARAERDLAEMRDQRSAAQRQLAAYEKTLADRATIETGWRGLQEARTQEADYNAKLRRDTELQARILKLDQAVQRARDGLEMERRRLADLQREQQKKVAAGQQQAALLAEAQAILAQMAEQQARRDAIAAEDRAAGERLATLKSDADRLRNEGEAIKEKSALILEQADSAACPVCRQPLTQAHREQILADYEAERAGLRGRYQAAQDEGRALADRRRALEAEDKGLAQALRARDARQRQAIQAEAAVADGQAAEAELARLAAAEAGLADRLAREDYAAEERAELAALRAEARALGYDPAAHDQARHRVNELAAFEARYQGQLLPALEGLAEAQQRVAAAEAVVARREAELAEDQARRQELAAAAAELPRQEAELSRLDAAVEQAAQAERRARQLEGAAMQQLDALDAQAVRRRQLSADLDAINDEISLYTELREAFGKKGLQAMIIESAIPEIEAEANRLLNCMSDGRMSVRLETQREKVTGGMAETLDIFIADEVGQRSYDLYSGGEAFRANLALRIAISKLLARRAGAQLQTLIIDEGFGSQDAQGLALVIEAINSIKDDFERVIIITHIDELKDMFPARIDVLKTAAGSRVTIA